MPRFDAFWVGASFMYATRKLYNSLYPNSFSVGKRDEIREVMRDT
jgi:hypothetical protein